MSSMDRPLVGKRPTFHRDKPRSGSYRILVLLFLITAATGFLVQLRTGEIQPLFQPTPTPTRAPQSYIQEADIYFATGKLDDPNTDNDAIDTYRRSLEVDPNNAAIWAQLARVQAYSSNLLATNEEKRARLGEALEAATRAVELNPDDGGHHAVRAFVLDWNATYAETPEEAEEYLAEALNEAVRALQLNPDDGLALAFYAEVQLDQQKWDEALKYAERAIALTPDSMDTRRVYGLVLESLGNYRRAIEEYQAAAELAPNMTFLYINIGVNYRYLALQSNFYPPQKNPLYLEALSYFEKAVRINEQLGVQDPLPYISIAKTYSQMGEFFIAARNAEKALSFDLTEANTYGSLGIIYFKSRNYESALSALRCAVQGCTADQNDVAKRLVKDYPQLELQSVPVEKMALDSPEVAYYYAEYGQVLAYLSRPEENFCAEALEVLEQVRRYPQADEVMMQIVNESQAICSRLEGSIPDAP